MHLIAIFASGTGSNARKIIEYFEHSPDVRVALIVSNNKNAGVLEIAQQHGIPVLLIDRKLFYETEGILQILEDHAVEWIILAGFLWLIPVYLIRAFPGKIINIHPALLPKYGGKGMYGMHVHEAVRAAGERESGITIHLVNEEYDKGAVLFQAHCALSENDTAEDIAHKVLALEHRFFPEVIGKLLREETAARS